MTTRGQQVSVAMIALFVPLAVAFAHDMRSELRLLRREVTEELRLTRASLDAAAKATNAHRERISERVTRVEARLALGDAHGR